ncbi:hypothetical protein JQ615_01020 [Bradyrhizobium jicamae]|uniref:Uncharacterized protein n=1 Tax=Bradyrhizobium jicamae TaxID=280332 RepID=A0ABS5FB52_9BRAD|nr:hypothetical protein [Bradyrhizobium jicamae]MBR0793962.1 hypothetical protein [Bradyrhizobium jicamae]
MAIFHRTTEENGRNITSVEYTPEENAVSERIGRLMEKENARLNRAYEGYLANAGVVSDYPALEYCDD